MKDFAKSYEQKSWQFAVSEHARMKEWITKFGSLNMQNYAQLRIRELESQYPQLKN